MCKYTVRLSERAGAVREVVEIEAGDVVSGRFNPENGIPALARGVPSETTP